MPTSAARANTISRWAPACRGDQELSRGTRHLAGADAHRQLWQGAPVAVCNDISCWSQNRRAVTVLTAANPKLAYNAKSRGFPRLFLCAWQQSNFRPTRRAKHLRQFWPERFSLPRFTRSLLLLGRAAVSRLCSKRRTCIFAGHRARAVSLLWAASAGPKSTITGHRGASRTRPGFRFASITWKASCARSPASSSRRSSRSASCRSS